MITPADITSLQAMPWIRVASPLGIGWLLMAAGLRTTLLLAPPGIALPDADLGNVEDWRLQTWWHDSEAEEPVELGIPEPDVLVFSTAEALAVLGAEYHGWVRGVMRGQVRDALAFASVAAGDCSNEERTRRSAARLCALRADLSQAFPREHWYVMTPVDHTTLDALMAQRSTPLPKNDEQPARWRRTVDSLVLDTVRRPRARKALLTVLTALTENLDRVSEATAEVTDQAKRALDTADLGDQPTENTLALSL